jgi:hypothetical protein
MRTEAENVWTRLFREVVTFLTNNYVLVASAVSRRSCERTGCIR